MGALYSDVELVAAGAVIVPEYLRVRYDGESLPVEFGEYIVDDEGNVYVRFGSYFVPFDDAEIVDRRDNPVSFDRLCLLMAEMA